MGRASSSVRPDLGLLLSAKEWFAPTELMPITAAGTHVSVPAGQTVSRAVYRSLSRPASLAPCSLILSLAPFPTCRSFPLAGRGETQLPWISSIRPISLSATLRTGCPRRSAHSNLLSGIGNHTTAVRITERIRQIRKTRPSEFSIVRFKLSLGLSRCITAVYKARIVASWASFCAWADFHGWS